MYVFHTGDKNEVQAPLTIYIYIYIFMQKNLKNQLQQTHVNNQKKVQDKKIKKNNKWRYSKERPYLIFKATKLSPW